MIRFQIANSLMVLQSQHGVAYISVTYKKTV